MKSRLTAFAAGITVSAFAIAGIVLIPGTRVSFEPPDGFTVLSSEEIGTKFPSSRAPSFVVGNERRSTTIACGLRPDDLPLEQLQDAKAAFEPLLERQIPGIEWKRRELVSISGQQWIYLEFSSHAIDTDIHNIMLITSLEGRSFLCNFNSTKAEFSRVEAALRKSIGSIALPHVAGTR